MKRDNIEDILPLTPLQSGLLFHTLSDPEAGYYWTQFSFDIKGPMRTDVFREAWQRAIARHACLRTVFSWENRDRPLQIVCKNAELPWSELDWSSYSAGEQAARFEEFLKQDRFAGCDLWKAPIMRLICIRLGKEWHRLVWAHHHLILDGWSLSLVLNEVLDEYDAMQLAVSETPPAVHTSMHHFIAWLSKQKWTEAEAFFRNRLAGLTAPTPLVTAKPRDKVLGLPADYASVHLSLPAEETTRLTSFVRANHITLNSLMQAAWGLMLHRYSGDNDVLFGVTLAGRSAPVPRIESTVGLFINTLPVRLTIDPDANVGRWLQSVHSMQAELLQHQYAPLLDVQGWSEIPRGLPLFESVFVFENYPVKSGWEHRANGAEIGGLRSVERSNFPLMILVAARKSVDIAATYDTRRFSAEAVRRMMAHYQTLLEAIVCGADGRVRDLNMLGAEERRQALEEWNQTQTTFPDVCLHQLFEAQVRRTPNALALEHGKCRWTYQELDARANQLAHYLKSFGVGAESLIGVCHERTPNLLVAILAVLKAGGAYVPLDPTYPKDRLDYILRQARAAVLLTTTRLLKQCIHPEIAESIPVVCLDTSEKAIARQPDDTLACVATPSNLAYVLYTSGSTGRPKGVQLEHKSPVALVSWARQLYSDKEIAGVLFSTSVCFDLSVYEMFVPLSWGGTIILAQDALELRELPARNRVTLINTVPSAIAELVRLEAIPKSVRTINLCGEALSAELADAIYHTTSVERVYDLYGPTEDTTYSTVALRRPGDAANIGRPLANKRAYVVDTFDKLCPVGVPGEICLSGVGLARGYLHQPDLTAERFVPNPFSNEPGARMYRTGDLGRYRDDGVLECLGRLDHQVKIRGFRIELGEIECVLSKNPAVKESVVVARDDAQGGKLLVAYLVSANGDLPSAEELREFVRAKLPEYMVPSAWVPLEKLPLTRNGKVDRKALPDPAFAGGSKEHAEPRDELERQLVEIWKEIFRRDKVSVRDDFFQLGGHSLLAVQLFMKLERATGRKLPMVTLFQAPSIEQLAAILRKETWREPWYSLVPIKESGSRAPFYCVHGVGGNILEYMDLARHMRPEQPFYGLQAAGLSGRHAWHGSVEEMAAHYIKEIRSLQPRGPYYIGGASFGGMVAYEMAQQLTMAGEKVALLALFDTWGPGYPKSLPSSSRLRKVWWHWRDRISLHYGNLRVVTGPERMEYVWGKGRKWWAGKKVRLARLRHRATLRIKHWMLPPEIRKTRKVGGFAMAKYITKPYPGDLTLFRATEQPSGIQPEPTLGWSGYVRGRIEVIETPGYHGAIVRDPRAKVLAAQIAECIQRAADAGAEPARTDALAPRGDNRVLAGQLQEA